MADQIGYLTSKDVGFDYNTTTKVFTIDSDTNDFNYFVQMGTRVRGPRLMLT